MFKVNNRKGQNKRTVEKFDPEKIIVEYLIRIVHRRNLAEKKLLYMYDYSFTMSTKILRLHFF